MKKYRDEPSTSRTPDMSASSSSSTVVSSAVGGGLKFAFEPQITSQPQQQSTSACLVVNTNSQAYLQNHTMKDSPPSSPGSEASARKRRKGTPQQSPHGGGSFETKRERDDKDSKILQNGAIPPTNSFPTHHMLGNTLNPSSSFAKNMTDTLNMEIEAHSIYTNETQSNLIGPQYPGRKDSVS
jgi:hypothetical protein